jgi:NADH-quinone oxidoreductase subunit M
MILLGAYQYASVATIFAASGVIFGATYMLWMYQRVMFGPLTNRANAAMPDLNAREIAYLAPLLVLIVVMGVYPQPFLDRINPSVNRFVARMEQGYRGAPYEQASNAAAAPATMAEGK